MVSDLSCGIRMFAHIFFLFLSQITRLTDGFLNQCIFHFISFQWRTHWTPRASYAAGGRVCSYGVTTSRQILQSLYILHLDVISTVSMMTHTSATTLPAVVPSPISSFPLLIQTWSVCEALLAAYLAGPRAWSLPRASEEFLLKDESSLVVTQLMYIQMTRDSNWTTANEP